MTDIEQYQAQLAQRRAQLEANRASVESTQFTKPRVPQRLLRTLTPGGQMKVRQQIGKAKREFEESKGVALGELQGGFSEQAQLETEFKPYQEAYQEQKAYEKAVDLYTKDVPYAFVEGREGKYLEKLYKTYGSYKTPQEMTKLQNYTPATLREVTNVTVKNTPSTITPKDLGVRPVNINLVQDTKKITTKTPKFNITGFSILPLASAANESALVNTKVANQKKFNLPKININPFKNVGGNASATKLNNKTIKNFNNIKWY